MFGFKNINSTGIFDHSAMFRSLARSLSFPFFSKSLCLIKIYPEMPHPLTIKWESLTSLKQY